MTWSTKALYAVAHGPRVAMSWHPCSFWPSIWTRPWDGTEGHLCAESGAKVRIPDSNWGLYLGGAKGEELMGSSVVVWDDSERGLDSMGVFRFEELFQFWQFHLPLILDDFGMFVIIIQTICIQSTIFLSRRNMTITSDSNEARLPRQLKDVKAWDSHRVKLLNLWWYKRCGIARWNEC